MNLKSFDEQLYQDLRDPEFAEAYLQDAWDDTLEEFLCGKSRCLARGPLPDAVREGQSRDPLCPVSSGSLRPSPGIHAGVGAGRCLKKPAPRR